MIGSREAARTGRLALIAGVLLFAAPSRAATFRVDSIVDEVDAAPGDGACATAGGACTLRAAVQESNALAGADVIDVPAGRYVLALVGADEDAAATGDLDLTDDLELVGAGRALTILSGARLDRLIDANGITLGLRDLAVEEGSVTPTTRIDGGGGVRLRDCNSTIERIEVRDCRVELALASLGSAELHGGGISFVGADHDLVLTDSSFLRNRAEGDARSSGGGLWLDTPRLLVRGCRFEGNKAAAGGGLAMELFPSGVLDQRRISSCDIAGNESLFGGGAVICRTVVTESTIRDNRSEQRFGGAWAYGSVLENVTISGNFAHQGGGISGNDPWAGASRGRHLTITDNYAYQAGGIYAYIVLSESIVSGNLSSPASADEADAASVTLSGPNVFGIAPRVAYGPASFLIVSPDARLGPLSDNGGGTLTHLPGATSGAIDAGGEACTRDDGTPMFADQRGELRPYDGDHDGIARCDFGAVEVTCRGADSDGDGMADECDCAPTDASFGGHLDPTLLLVTKAVTTPILTWVDAIPPSAAPLAHDIAADAISTMWTARAATAPCIVNGVLGGSFVDTASPAGISQYYLVRPVHPCVSSLASWGTNSFGVRRPTCP